MSGQCLSPSEPGHALTPGTHLSLGGLLPRQQANRQQTDLRAESHHLILRCYPVLLAVSRYYPGPEGTYLPVTLPFAAPPSSKLDLSRDLHA